MLVHCSLSLLSLSLSPSLPPSLPPSLSSSVFTDGGGGRQLCAGEEESDRLSPEPLPEHLRQWLESFSYWSGELKMKALDALIPQ